DRQGGVGDRGRRAAPAGELSTASRKPPLRPHSPASGPFAQPVPCRADVKPAGALADERIPPIADRVEDGQRPVRRRAEREPDVLERPLQREVRRVVTGVHLAELGERKWRSEVPGAQEIKYLIVSDAE